MVILRRADNPSVWDVRVDRPGFDRKVKLGASLTWIPAQIRWCVVGRPVDSLRKCFLRYTNLIWPFEQGTTNNWCEGTRSGPIAMD